MVKVCAVWFLLSNTGAVPAMKPEATAIGDPQDGRWKITLSFDGRICWGLSAGYQPRPQVVDRGTTARYGGQLRYI